MIDDVLYSVEGGVVEITLNRPEALNALTLEMAQILHERLTTWAMDDSVRAVVVRGAGERAFCAGGDIRALYDAKQENGPLTRDFFRNEYLLNHLVFHYPKPYIALVDGIAMGGGVGLSVHAGIRIASEVTMFAMPETGIGLFPDVDARINFNVDTLNAGMVVADVIPNPPQTNLVKDARAKGCKVIDGLGMLVNQGVIGIRYWTGVDPDPSVMRNALEEIFG